MSVKPWVFKFKTNTKFYFYISSSKLFSHILFAFLVNEKLVERLIYIIHVETL